MKLFQRSKPGPPALAAALERLSRLADDSPALREAATLQSLMLRTIYARPAAIGTIAMPPERAAAKLSGGQPLLHAEDVPIDLPALATLLPRLADAIAAHTTPGAAADIAAAARSGALSVPALARHALDAEADAVRDRAAELGLSGELLGTLLRFSLFPALTQLAAQLAPALSAAAWDHGYCPVCGGAPVLGEHRGLEQLRFLRCGLCAGAWQVDRLWCPFCGSRDHNHLSYLHVEGDEQRRANTCEQCRGYIKVLATLGPLAPLDLLVADVATLPLDLIALERGYGRS